MPSFTFVSTANAFALRGAKIVFVDIKPADMNMDEDALQAAITEKTKAIVVTQYAGVACEMDTIMDIAGKRGIFVVEDAAQGILSTYKGRYLGALGDIGCISFHETKNLTCGEGGVLLLNDERFIERAEIIIEKGTNRSQFNRGEIDKYTWVGLGSSYVPSELNCAFLYAQLELAEEITAERVKNWNLYFELLKPLADKGLISLPNISKHCVHNGHIFYIKAGDEAERPRLMQHLGNNGIKSTFHFVPLHGTETGRRRGRFSGEDGWTTKESRLILRLPIYYNIPVEGIVKTAKTVMSFYGVRG
jgi:dTDP-4-amino-4,6-dideoxygalactose transaminase